MSSPNHTPQRAILLFTRSPQNEARHKPLSHRLTFDERVELYESFTRHVLRQAEATGYPVLVAADAPEYDFGRHASTVAAVLPQSGMTFGQRLTQAFADAFAQGYDEIVCVGNDCIELTVSSLQAAFAQLTESPLVLGAARDGGVYLIGMRRSVLDQALRVFASCHWQTGIALADLLDAARSFDITTRVLSPHADIDVVDDLIAAARRLPGLAFLKKFAGKVSSAPIFSPLISTPLRTSQVDRHRFQKSPPAAQL